MKKFLPAVALGVAALSTVALSTPAFASGSAASASRGTRPQTVAATGSSPSAARNVVLVHGALADGSGWKGVYDRLTRHGFRVTVAQLPETSLADDVATVRRAIAAQDGPTVLVGHSYGGVVITQAGDDPKVRSLVYVAAGVPDVGEWLNDLFAKIPSPTHDIKPTPDGYLQLDPAKFPADFAADLPKRDAEFTAHSQMLVNAQVFDTEVTTAAWKTRPSYGIVPTKDLIASPDLERYVYQHAGAKIIEVQGSSDAVYISHASKVASVIEEAAGR